MRDWAWRGPERRAYTRREWVSATAASVLITPLTESAGATGAVPSQQPASAPLPLTQFQPKSMLHVGETRVQRARFPVIDFHTHVSRRRAQKPGVPPGELVKTMDAVNLHTMVNLTGGAGDDLAGAIAGFDRAFPRRFVSMTEPSWTRAGETGYAAWQADEIGRAKAAGAVGVKVLKTLGLYLRDGGASGKLVRVDDARFDPMWETCGRLGLPVAIHVGDPEAFFLPIDRFNERYEELNAHPDWSFHGKDFPAFKEILEARDRVFARHPKTTFVALHVGHWAENLAGGRRDARQVPERPRRDRRAHRRARPPAAHGGAVLRPVPGPHPVRHRRRSRSASKRRSRCSARTCTGSTTASSRPRTSTSTTRRRRCRRRADGGSTASGCRNRSCARSTHQNAERVLGRKLVTA